MFTETSAHIIRFKGSLKYNSLPLVIDDLSLAYNLGINLKTLWWLITHNTIDKLENKKTRLYREYKIPKSSGGYRTINEPMPVLKNVQKAILMTFFNRIPSPDHFGAYVEGRGLEYTAKKHVGKQVKIALDIKSFFPSTRRAWVRNFIRDLGYNDWVVENLSNLVIIPRRINEDLVVSGLPQGAPTSCSISNWVANKRIDTPCMEFLDSTGESYVYTRYSDNLEISFKRNLSFSETDDITKKLISIIKDSKYRVNYKKVDVQRKKSPKRPMKVLGFTVNEKVNIPRREYRRLRAIIHNCKTKGFDTQYKRAGYDSDAQMASSLHSKLIYWRNVNKDKIQPLIDKFVIAAKDQGLM